MKLANCHKCGTQGKTTKNEILGDTFFAFCPKCQWDHTDSTLVEAVTRDEAVKEWNEINKEANNADNDK